MTDTVPTPAQRESERDTHTSAPVLNVYRRMSKACEIIDGMEWVKDMSNTQYKSVPIDKMRAGVRKACIMAGLVHLGPENIEIERDRTDRTFRLTATCTFRYINIDNPEEVIVCESVGEAMDNGDKGTAKVVSNLIKNHYKAQFDIGEQGKDDIDSYSNEELYAEADRIEKNRQNLRKEATQDSFFGGAKKKKPSESRDTEQMRQTILTVIKDKDRPQLAETFNRYRAEFGLFRDWSDEIVGRCYNEIVAQAGEVRE